MERNNIAALNKENSLQTLIGREKQNRGGGISGWWYQYFAPPEPPRTASFAQREKARHGRMASIAVLIMILFLLTLFPQSIASKDFMQIVLALIGISTCFFALFLNRRGFVEIAGALILIQLYSGQVFTILTVPGGLTLSNLGQLDFTVLPDILVLAFFPANSLFLIVCINIIMTGAIVVYGPHDSMITSLLHNVPQQIFAHTYILQLITAEALYLWARSTEQALKRADWAEEIAALEKRENEQQQRELERKHKLDVGVQQLLQTLVAVANGDLKVRAPLSKDHVLWQVSGALNNLIARLQSLSYIEGALQQKVPEESVRVASHHIYAETGKFARVEPGGIAERGRRQWARQGSERVVGLRARAETGKVERVVPGSIADHVRKLNEEAMKPLIDPGKKSSS